MTKSAIQRYYLIEGNVIEFSSKEDLQKWIQDYIDKNPGKSLTLENTTKKTTAILGNEVSFKTEVVTETKQVEMQVLKVELGDIKTI